eukprot:scaffold153967_cov18-Tisochrysis_lutea.AAC.1
MQVAAALKTLGLHLDDSEVERLFGRLDITNTGKVERSMVAASQVGMKLFQISTGKVKRRMGAAIQIGTVLALCQ